MSGQITKRKADGGWQLLIDGKPVKIYVYRGPAPKWGHPQTYDVMHGSGADAFWLFEARSVANAEQTIGRIVAEALSAESGEDR